VIGVVIRVSDKEIINDESIIKTLETPKKKYYVEIKDEEGDDEYSAVFKLDNNQLRKLTNILEYYKLDFGWENL
jgi:chemotaxis protein CheY-P-specific phosphatase CheC